MFSLFTVFGIALALVFLVWGVYAHFLWLVALYASSLDSIALFFAILLIGGGLLITGDVLYINWIQALNHDVSMIGK